jgi:hypothetical protein
LESEDERSMVLELSKNILSISDLTDKLFNQIHNNKLLTLTNLLSGIYK